MANEIKVEVIQVKPIEELPNNFRKRELICKDEGQYSQEYCIEFVQDKVDLIDNLRPGQTTTVHYNLRSRKYHNDSKNVDQYFLSMSGWKIS